MLLSFDDIDLTIAGLRAHYQSGDFTPRDLIALLRARSAEFRERNIWIHELSDREIEPYLAALDNRSVDDAPLFGIPFAIKDNIDLAQIPTTAACAAVAYTPGEHAFVVANLIEAGAIPLGKTNLDQLATGLNGTRSPWGACRNSFDPDYISGGSSSGSAVAVALGLASFALGTDTAGSGRVPASFNNIVGWKPSRGLLSTRGMLPACKSIDCMSVFALTASDLNTLIPCAARYDATDAYARHNPAHNFPEKSGAQFFGTPEQKFEFGVPRARQLRFFGDADAQDAFAQSVQLLENMGGIKREIDFSDFLDAARLLYEGPWVAERYHGIRELIEENPSALLPVIATIIGAGRDKSAVDTFDAMYQMQTLRRSIEATIADLEFIATPTAGRHFTIEEMLAEPILRNSELGYYTNFMNLLDLAAVAVPTQLMNNGMPFGITLFADRFTDLRLLSYAQQIQATTQLPLGATGNSYALPTLPARAELSTCKVVVCGAHLSGLSFNGQLLARQATLIAATKTSPNYRLYALPGGSVQRPGLIRVDKQGAAIEVEVWEMPGSEFGSFVAAIPQPLGIGKVELENGEWLPGFICEGYAVDGAADISESGGWRAYLKA
ncbi:MAG TPA: allophanate hydrolase [Spongiibacteraceae bacterium]|nr:allophanate hydrolase [Spongiibacteraceae bacterium]